MNTVFLLSEINDPFRIYAKMREEAPVYLDEENKIWTIYGYRECDFFLKSGVAEIPSKASLSEGKWNKYARMVRENLVRRSNPPQHRTLKKAATDLVRLMQPVNIPETLDELLKGADTEKLNWSGTVAKVLPLTALLRGLQFHKEDIDFIVSHMATVKMFMTGTNGEEQVRQLNTVSERLYPLVESHLEQTFPDVVFEEKEIYVSNLIGLCIQGYDALRGLLSNSLLQYVCRRDVREEGEGDYFRKLVTETLRFDPVFHHTRRVLKEDIETGGHRFKKGEELLLVLASANRDVSVFHNADTFDIHRGNNREYSSFSSGIHSCPADHFSISLAADTLAYMTSKYRDMELLQPEITYTPMTNARIPENITLKLSV